MKSISESAFIVLLRELRSVIDVDRDIPERVFRNATWLAGLTSFDLCFSPDMIRSCERACGVTGDSTFTFIAIDPDPLQYYYREFGRIPALTIDRGDDPDVVWNAFTEDPGNSLADALLYSVRKFAVFSQSERWAVWGDRMRELIIWGSASRAVLDAFSLGGCRLYTVSEAKEDLFIDDTIDQADIRSLQANYGRKWE